MKNRMIIKFLMLVVMVLAPQVEIAAQDWKDVLSNVASSLGEQVSEKVAEKGKLFSVEGTWTYTKPDCKFESENLLSKAGGELAAKTIEKKMTEIMQKIGLTDKAVFCFNSDSTYTITSSKRVTKGTYSLNKETKEIELVSQLNFHFKAKVAKNVLAPNKMSLLFNADKLMGLVQNITGKLAKNSSHKSIVAANALLNQFNGLMLGFELEKGDQNSSLAEK